MDQRGSAGGRATFERHGREPIKAIGAKGFQSLVAGRFQGDRRGAIDGPHPRAHEARIDSFVDRELGRRLDQGEKVSSMESPVLSDPDEGLPC